MGPKIDPHYQKNNVPVPIFDVKVRSYESWRKDVLRWCIVSKLSEVEKAYTISNSLTDRARTSADLMPDEELLSENGVKNLLKKLDKVYMKNKHSKKFDLFSSLYNLKKGKGTSMHDYICDFQHTYDKFRLEQAEVDDTVLAYMLLASCQLPKEKEELVKTGLTEEFTFDNMVSALKRILGRDSDETGEHNSYGGESSRDGDTFYNMGRGRRAQRGRWGSRSNSRSQSRRRPNGTERRSYVPERSSVRTSDQEMNPIGRDGRVSACMICRSIYHWHRECPNKASYKIPDTAGGNKSSDVQFTLGDDHTSSDVEFTLVNFCGDNKSSDVQFKPGDDHTSSDGKSSDVQFKLGDDHTSSDGEATLFCGYTASKLQELTQECDGYAILDSGCSNTVCGEEWLRLFIERLSDEERQRMIIEPSEQTFTFGNGSAAASLRKVTMPCWMGGRPGMLSTDVIESNIPLLLSKRSMKKNKMKLDFDRDEVTVGGRIIKLKVTKSEHYALPISL